MALTVQEIAVNATVSAYLIPQKKGVATGAQWSAPRTCSTAWGS